MKALPIISVLLVLLYSCESGPDQPDPEMQQEIYAGIKAEGQILVPVNEDLTRETTRYEYDDYIQEVSVGKSYCYRLSGDECGFGISIANFGPFWGIFATLNANYEVYNYLVSTGFRLDTCKLWNGSNYFGNMFFNYGMDTVSCIALRIIDNNDTLYAWMKLQVVRDDILRLYEYAY